MISLGGSPKTLRAEAEDSVDACQPIDLWHADLDDFTPAPGALKQTLAADEFAHADRLRFPWHRHRYQASRFLLRTILSTYGEKAPCRLRFCYGTQGKPELEPQADQARVVIFNQTHSGGRWVLAVGRGGALGVDVEALRPLPEIDQLIRVVCTAVEMEKLGSLPMGRRLAEFYAMWTCKEAVLKALGLGLSRSPRSVEVNVSLHEPPRLVSLDGSCEAAAGWHLRLFSLEPDHIGCVAAEGPAPHIAHAKVAHVDVKAAAHGCADAKIRVQSRSCRSTLPAWEHYRLPKARLPCRSCHPWSLSSRQAAAT